MRCEVKEENKIDIICSKCPDDHKRGFTIVKCSTCNAIWKKIGYDNLNMKPTGNVN